MLMKQEETYEDLQVTTLLLITSSVSSMESSCLTLASRLEISRYNLFNWWAKILFSARSSSKRDEEVEDSSVVDERVNADEEMEAA